MTILDSSSDSPATDNPLSAAMAAVSISDPVQELSVPPPVPPAVQATIGKSPSFRGGVGLFDEDKNVLDIKTDVDSKVPTDVKNVLRNLKSPSEFSTLSAMSNRSAGDSVKVQNKEVGLYCSAIKPLEEICGGYIGTNQLAFCTRKQNQCSVFIKRGAHYRNRFKVQDLTSYIGRTAGSAWVDHSAPSMMVNRLKSAVGTLPDVMTMDKWKLILAAASSIQSEDKDDDIYRTLRFAISPVKATYLKTPSKSKNNIMTKPDVDSQEWMLPIDVTADEAVYDELDKALATVHFDSEELNSDPNLKPISESLSSMIHVLKLVRENMSDLSRKLEQKSEQDTVAEDMLNLTTSLLAVKATIGESNGIFPDLSIGIQELSSTMNMLTSEVSDHDKRLVLLDKKAIQSDNYWNDLTKNWLPNIVAHEEKLANFSVLLENLEEKLRESPSNVQQSNDSGHSLLGLSPTEMLARRTSSVLPSRDLNAQKLAILEAKCAEQDQKLQEMQSAITLWQHQNTPSIGHTDFTQYQGDIRLKPDSLNSEAIHYKQWNFPNGEDSIYKWMKKNLPSPGQSWFVDLVSFLSYIGEDVHTATGDILSDLYKSNRIGHGNIGDSIVAASFQNMLPAVLGKKSFHSSSSADDAFDSRADLPGIPSHNVWDGKDGATGKRYFLLRHIRNTNIQIDGWIRSDLQSDAQMLAKELLTDSVSMALDLVSYLSSSFQDIRNSGRYDDDQTWELVSKCTKRIFSELADARIVAKDGIRCGDPWYTASKCLYGTLKAHKIMHDFTRLEIKNHPSISSEMVKFVCFSQPATDTADLIQRLAVTENVAKQAQGVGSRLETRTKKLEAANVDINKLLKKLKDKANIA